jgi:hypothetical protein
VTLVPHYGEHELLELALLDVLVGIDVCLQQLRYREVLLVVVNVVDVAAGLDLIEVKCGSKVAKKRALHAYVASV